MNWDKTFESVNRLDAQWVVCSDSLFCLVIVVVYGEIKSMIGGRAELPCNLTLPSPDDAIQLIFWYRGNSSRVPLYSVDSRVSALANATHFHSDIYTPRRATFELTTKPSALLIIDPVLEDDHGDYRCRVDFRWGRTINSFVSLHVIGKSLPTKFIFQSIQIISFPLSSASEKNYNSWSKWQLRAQFNNWPV